MRGDAVLFISDLHTHYGVINEQILHAENSGCSVSRVIVLGDFGVFGSHLHKYFRRREKLFLRPVSFIDGNHEDHGSLLSLAAQYADVVEFLPRSSLVSLGSFKGLCLGGTKYMDAASTPRGSEISETDLAACFTHNPESVDLIMTHDCPDNVGVPGTPGMEGYGPPGVPAFSQLAKYFQPRYWFFGHHHRWFDQEHHGTRYLGLPESWVGYVLFSHHGDIEVVEHHIDLGKKPWWQRWLGLK